MSWLPPSHLDHQLSDNRLRNQNTSLGFPNWIVSIFVSRSAALGKIEPSSGGLTCRVRCATLDDLFCFGGHDRRAPPSGNDKRAPPIFRSEGRARRVRFRRDPLVGSDAPRLIIHSASAGTTGVPLRYGRDRHAPPSGQDKRAGPACSTPHLRIRHARPFERNPLQGYSRTRAAL